MSFLPKKIPDSVALAIAGYEVKYHGYGYDPVYGVRSDELANKVELSNAIKMVITKDGVIDSPEDEPSVIYFDKKSRQIFAALWIKEGKLHRDGAPAGVCERSTETGCPPDTKYTVLAYYQNDLLHNENGPAIILDELNKYGQMIRETEDYFLKGRLQKYARRDVDTGRIEPDYSSPEFHEKSAPEPLI
jgi:hypothetical protein